MRATASGSHEGLPGGACNAARNRARTRHGFPHARDGGTHWGSQRRPFRTSSRREEEKVLPRVRPTERGWQAGRVPKMGNFHSGERDALLRPGICNPTGVTPQPSVPGLQKSRRAPGRGPRAKTRQLFERTIQAPLFAPCIERQARATREHAWPCRQIFFCRRRPLVDLRAILPVSSDARHFSESPSDRGTNGRPSTWVDPKRFAWTGDRLVLTPGPGRNFQETFVGVAGNLHRSAPGGATGTRGGGSRRSPPSPDSAHPRRTGFAPLPPRAP